MNYTVSGNIIAHQQATFTSKQTNVSFGIKRDQNYLPNPAELLLGAFAACCLKNIERFSDTLKFNYEDARIEVLGERQERPTKLVAIQYTIHIKSEDASLNVKLLHKNLQKFGTIYNTLKETCNISGEIKLID
ncbi:OsmC family protein [Aquimarina muelleri]|uniref:Osmotically inducible protein C n=1 Tax=Aquimarina muelleri TaxID=279356 RepID=A0A918JTC1_9FLAO|nr:OsmC family protein [Aquimarina muelleri]MCX2763907.1 OsmC family protein [Aquimarina muelleri]GGX11055.1 hypothetical protein GCM10007384_11010 [Aquimarina muelleri]